LAQAARRQNRSKGWSDAMDAEHRVLLIKTWELIETTRKEVLGLREEIRLAQNTINQSRKLLSRAEQSVNRLANPARSL
jgi:hypothetical protein